MEPYSTTDYIGIAVTATLIYAATGIASVALFGAFEHRFVATPRLVVANLFLWPLLLPAYALYRLYMAVVKNV